MTVFIRPIMFVVSHACTCGFGVGKRHEKFAVVFGAGFQNALQHLGAGVHFFFGPLHDHLL